MASPAAWEGDSFTSTARLRNSAMYGRTAGGVWVPMAVAASGAQLAALAGASVPNGAVQIGNSSGNVANAAAVATLANAAAKTTYITGFQLTASGATVGLDVVATVAGLLGGTESFIFNFPAGALVGAAPLLVTFPTPLPASAVNTAIVVTLPAGGAGNTNAAASAQGYQL